MNLKWTKHFTDEEQKQKFIQLLKNSHRVLAVLSQIIESNYNTLLRHEESEDSYSKNWTYLQAHRNGKREAYKEILALLDLERTNTDE